MSEHNRYYSRDGGLYNKMRFMAEGFLQSAEMNELQAMIRHHNRTMFNVLFRDGALLEGNAPVLTGGTGIFPQSKIYSDGTGQIVPEGVVEFSEVGDVVVGVFVSPQILDAETNPEFRDPAIGTRAYDEEGASRELLNLVWMNQEDVVAPENPDYTYFYPVYRIRDGVLLQNSPPPEMDATLALVARYDRQSNGHYVVEGMTAQAITQTFPAVDSAAVSISVLEGLAHVYGFEVYKYTSTRINETIPVDLDNIVGEVKTYTESGGVATISVNRSPIADIQSVRITKQTSETITRGGTAGGTDILPDDAISSIVSVVQGGTTYAPGTWNFTGIGLDWSPAGAEPAPGTTYTVTYRYIDVVVPTAITNNTFQITGGVVGTDVSIDYRWKMKRIDTLALRQDGTFGLVRGQPTRYIPKPADVPKELLAIATVAYDWVNLPVVSNIATRVTPMNELEAMKDQIDKLMNLVAIERLRNNSNASDPATKEGVFVDPFLDDDMRDAGIPQTAAIFNGEMTLSVVPTIYEASGSMGVVETIGYTLEPILSQLQATGQMLINPYSSFEPIPAKLTVTQAVDNYTEIETIWRSPITRRITEFSNETPGTFIGERVVNTVVSSSTTQSQFLRQRSINLKAENFGAGEVVASVTIDGVAFVLP